jgi:hypothetical protein
MITYAPGNESMTILDPLSDITKFVFTSSSILISEKKKKLLLNFKSPPNSYSGQTRGITRFQKVNIYG